MKNEGAAGQSEAYRITNVTLKNVTILGQEIRDLKDLHASVNEFCEGVAVE